MAKTFQAAVLTELKKPLEIWNIEFPELLQGQVLVKNFASGICRSQLMECSGSRGEDKWLPHLLGHEGVGEVQEVGPGVTKVKPGDLVVTSWISGTGIQSANPNFFSSSGDVVNSGSATTFSEFSVVSENRTFLAPEGFPIKFLPQFGCALLTGGGMVVSTLRNRKLLNGTRVLVLGFGGVGTAAALVLRSYPELKITIVEQSEERRESAKAHGFEKVFSSLEEYCQISGSKDLDFDFCFESAGSVQSIEIGFGAISNQGQLIFASHPPKGDRISLDPFDFILGKSIRGTWGGDSLPEDAMREVGKRLFDTNVNFELMTGPSFALAEVNDGLSYLAAGRPGKPIITFGEYADAK